MTVRTAGGDIRVAAAAIAAGAAGIIAAAPALADEVADFYRGKQITIVVVSGSGGMNALYGRTLGDRMLGVFALAARLRAGGAALSTAASVSSTRPPRCWAWSTPPSGGRPV